MSADIEMHNISFRKQQRDELEQQWRQRLASLKMAIPDGGKEDDILSHPLFDGYSSQAEKKQRLEELKAEKQRLADLFASGHEAQLTEALRKELQGRQATTRKDRREEFNALDQEQGFTRKHPILTKVLAVLLVLLAVASLIFSGGFSAFLLAGIGAAMATGAGIALKKGIKNKALNYACKFMLAIGLIATGLGLLAGILGALGIGGAFTSGLSTALSNAASWIANTAIPWIGNAFASIGHLFLNLVKGFLDMIGIGGGFIPTSGAAETLTGIGIVTAAGKSMKSAYESRGDKKKITELEKQLEEMKDKQEETERTKKSLQQQLRDARALSNDSNNEQVKKLTEQIAAKEKENTQLRTKIGELEKQIADKTTTVVPSSPVVRT